MHLFQEISDALRTNLKITISFSTAALFAFGSIALLVIWRDSMVWLGALVGAALGWAIGILLAPYEEEQKRFQRLSKSIAGFLAGYVAAKIDRIFELLIDKTGGGPLISNLRVLRSLLTKVCAKICFSSLSFAKTFCSASRKILR